MPGATDCTQQLLMSQCNYDAAGIILNLLCVLSVLKYCHNVTSVLPRKSKNVSQHNWPYMLKTEFLLKSSFLNMYGQNEKTPTFDLILLDRISNASFFDKLTNLCFFVSISSFLSKKALKMIFYGRPFWVDSKLVFSLKI